MPTLFSKIINGEIPCHKILEDKNYLAFLEIQPINPGHTLVIPKQETDYIFDVNDEMLSELMIFAKKVAQQIKRKITCKRIGVMVCGLEVPHTHIHLIPINSSLDLNFKNAKPASTEELRDIAKKISNNI